MDFGCGSGRDTRYFLDQGYQVEAVDGSKEMCRLAARYTGMEVRHMFFQELSEKKKYDGIWACSFILDLPLQELAVFMQKTEGLETEEQWITSDVRPGRGEEKWLNLILRKK